MNINTAIIPVAAMVNAIDLELTTLNVQVPA
jgi:hypothetical protein